MLPFSRHLHPSVSHAINMCSSITFVLCAGHFEKCLGSFVFIQWNSTLFGYQHFFKYLLLSSGEDSHTGLKWNMDEYIMTDFHFLTITQGMTLCFFKYKITFWNTFDFKINITVYETKCVLLIVSVTWQTFAQKSLSLQSFCSLLYILYGTVYKMTAGRSQTG